MSQIRAHGLTSKPVKGGVEKPRVFLRFLGIPIESLSCLPRVCTSSLHLFAARHSTRECLADIAAETVASAKPLCSPGQPGHPSGIGIGWPLSGNSNLEAVVERLAVTNRGISLRLPSGRRFLKTFSDSVRVETYQIFLVSAARKKFILQVISRI